MRNLRTVAHEVSHMWFGNLVTCAWWDDIWLNEGFARYCEHHILETIHPEFEIWKKYMTEVYMQAMRLDYRLRQTHPIKMEVPTIEERKVVIDVISYAKGSIVCRMMADYIGDDFKELLLTYVHKYKYANSTTANLLAIGDEVCKKSKTLK